MESSVQVFRDVFKLRIDDFFYDVNSQEGGSFDCPFLEFRVQCNSNTENISEAFIQAEIILKHYHYASGEEFESLWNQIFREFL